MSNSITSKIEAIAYDELLAYLRYQANDFFPSLKDEEWLFAFSTKLYNLAEFCFCRDNGRLVGMMAFYANGQGADFAYITHVYVSPMFRRKGIFSKMLEIVVRHIKEKGFHEIRLEVDKQNKRAQLCYQCNGFEIMPSQDSDLPSFYMSKIV